MQLLLSPHFRRVFPSIACSRRVSADVEHKRSHLVCADGHEQIAEVFDPSRSVVGRYCVQNPLTSTVYASTHDSRLFHTEGALNGVHKSKVTFSVLRMRQKTSASRAVNLPVIYTQKKKQINLYCFVCLLIYIHYIFVHLLVSHPSPYISVMRSEYFSWTTLRFSFIVGVSSPPPTLRSVGITRNF